VIGGGLAPSSRSWASTDLTGGNLPNAIDNVSVSVNGAPAEISFVGPSQVDFLIPANAAVGPAQIQVINNGQISAPATVNLTVTAPAFFYLTGNKYIVSAHSNGTVTGPTTIAGATPVKAGETISLYGTGFTVNTPGVGAATLPTVTIGGLPATVTFGGLIDLGIYQVNVIVPSTLTTGDAAVVATMAGNQSQANAFISIQ